MDNQTNNSTIAEFVNKNTRTIINAEKISIPILLLGLLLHFLEIKNTEVFLVLGCISTAIIYFLFAFLVVDAENIEATGILNTYGFINFIYKLTFFGLSIASLSVLSLEIVAFKSTELITISGLTLTTVLIISVITRINDRSDIYNRVYYIRILPALLILFYMANIKFHWF
jgi:hypothetical protein